MDYGGFIASAAELGLDLDEGQSLTSALDSAIWTLQSYYQGVIATKLLRDASYYFLIYLIDLHNSKHNTPSVDYLKPIRAPWTIGIDRHGYPCAGGCGMIMDSPISSHKTNCMACGEDYYVCRNEDVERHKERPCTRMIKYTEWVTDERGNTYRRITYRACPEKHRWCSPSEGIHSVWRDLNGNPGSSKSQHKPGPPFEGIPPVHAH